MFLGSFYFKVVQGHRMEAEVRRQDVMKLSIYWHDLHVTEYMFNEPSLFPHL